MPQFMKIGKSAAFLLITAVSCVLTGCANTDGPGLGQVSGTVTLDGQPLDGATVEFQPASGRGSVGQTDANGNYQLLYTNERNGATIGSHTVRITTVRPASGGEGEQPAAAARDELLPPKYHSETELTYNVKAGSNTADFALTSK